MIVTILEPGNDTDFFKQVLCFQKQDLTNPTDGI